jgi:hypothetical protein
MGVTPRPGAVLSTRNFLSRAELLLKIYSLTARFLRALALSRAFLSALRIKLSITSSRKNTRLPTFAGIKRPIAINLSKLDNEMSPSRLRVSPLSLNTSRPSFLCVVTRASMLVCVNLSKMVGSQNGFYGVWVTKNGGSRF